MLLVESLLGSSSAATNPYVEDVFSTYLYTQDTGGVNDKPLITNVGFTSTDAWQSVAYPSGVGLSYACAFDSSGNFYVTMSQSIGGVYAAYVAKYTSAGVNSWITQLTSSANYLVVKSIRVAASGSVYLGGKRSGSNLPFVCKLTSAGAVDWSREITGGYSNDVYMDIDSSENVHIAYTGSLTGKYARFNSSGTQDTTVSKTFSTATQTFVKGLTVDSSGNIYICGSYYNSSLTRYTGYVIKFDSSMALQWNRGLYTAAGSPSFEAVSVDSSGNVYVTGVMQPATYDVVAYAKYNSSGTLQWQNQLSVSAVSVQGYALKSDSSGNLYITGNSGDSWSIFKTNTSGTVQWQKSYTPIGDPSNVFGRSIDIDAAGNLLVAGSGSSTSTIYPQALKISQTGASSGITDYGNLADSNLTSSSLSATAETVSFTISAGSSFSTVTYTGTSATITSTLISIAASTSTGGLLWLKSRSAIESNILALSTSSYLSSNTTGAASAASYVRALSSNGAVINNNSTSNTYAAWTFREQAKFFDVVTYTGTGANRTIAHNLGAVPGCIMIKRTDTTAAWAVYHRSLANTQYMVLNTTAAAATGATYWNSTTPTSSVFSLGTSTDVNASGGTYVAYLFAHDAGGFGASGTDNVISCGSFTTDGSSKATVNLGYEPQYVMVKRTNSTSDWLVFDTMRGMTIDADSFLKANTSEAEGAGYDFIDPTSTGFTIDFSLFPYASSTFIYIAIRRGPMKTPTTGTSVFGLSARTGTGANVTVTGGQTDDTILIKNRGAAYPTLFSSRLTGTGYLIASGSSAETAAGTTILQANPWDVMDGVKVGTTDSIANASANTYINYLIRRAPGFFDTVCYTGTGAARTISHNLGAVPQLIIVKSRSLGYAWEVYYGDVTKLMELNSTGAAFNANTLWNSTAPTASVFSVGNNITVNESTTTYIAYLFGTVAGVSKVGTYTGTGGTTQINCGFTGGARFIMIKRIDAIGPWYVWDTARGIVAGNDPYFLLNSTAVEVTGLDFVDTYSAGFELSSAATASLNALGGNYLFLAIA